MFKSWRNGKNKIKAVFKLQFQVTQVPRLKKSALIISLVPEDVGKTTFKLEKAPIEEGTCAWENPIYVSVKLIRDPKTGTLSEKIYHFVVATGSSKSGFLGQASIDFADFVTETERVTVSLPLKFANSGAVLHVTIEKIQDATNQRHVEENSDPTLSADDTSKSQQNNYFKEETKLNVAEDNQLDNIVPKHAEQYGSFRDSIGTKSTLASRSENGSEPNSNLPHRQNSIPPTTKKYGHQRSNTDWSVGSASDGSFVESTYSADENFRRESPEDSNNSTEKLKSEIAAFIRQADVSELEIQSLRKQVTKESKRTQDLSREIESIREDRDSIYEECQQLKSQIRVNDDAKAESSKFLLEAIREELNCEKDLNKNLRLQLQRTQDSNSNLILAVRDLNELLEQKHKDIVNLSSELEASKNLVDVMERECSCEMDDSKDQSAAKESVQEPNGSVELDAMKQTLTSLYQEIELNKRTNEELDMQLKQLIKENDILKEENQDISFKLEQLEEMKTQNVCSDSTVVIEELESQTLRLEDKIKQQSLEFSESLTDINELERQVKQLKKELEDQAQMFQDELDAVGRAKTEQEQRATRAEETLKTNRWKNAITAERLQEKFKRLSIDMASKLDESEKNSTKAETEANELRMQNKVLEEMLQNTKKEFEEINDQNEIKLEKLLSQIDLKANEIEEKHLELDNKSTQLEAFTIETNSLRTEIAKLNREKLEFLELAEQNSRLKNETEKTKSMMSEKDMLIQGWKTERDDWKKQIVSAKEEAKKAEEQLLAVRSLKNENDTAITNLTMEVENLSLQYNKVRSSLLEEKKEKHNLKEQILKLKDDIQRKEEDNNLKVLLTSPSKGGNLIKSLDELRLVKEKNKSMERELQEMQERYSEISLKFAEVEGERQQLVMTVRNLKNGKK